MTTDSINTTDIQVLDTQLWKDIKAAQDEVALSLKLKLDDVMEKYKDTDELKSLLGMGTIEGCNSFAHQELGYRLEVNFKYKNPTVKNNDWP